MMIKNIIILIQKSLNSRDFHRYGLEILKSKGFNLIIFDLERVFQTVKKKANYVNSDLNIIESKENIIEFLKIVDKSYIVICLIGLDFNYRYSFIFKNLFKKRIKIGYITCGQVPLQVLEIKVRERVVNLFYSKDLYRKMIDKIKNYIFFKHYKFDFVMIGGELSPNLKSHIQRDTLIIKSHSFDYDRYLENENLKLNAKLKEYAVFLDQFIPYHPDCNIVKPYCKPEIYYDSINLFFDFFEKEKGIPLVICAHPRANYGINNNPYNNRDVVYSNSIELVKNSQLVFAHASTAINYSIIYNKPLYFLIHPAYSNMFKNEIYSTSKSLNMVPIDISKKYSFDSSLKINKKSYNNYFYKYIKSKGSPEKASWRIFADNCDKLV